MRGAFQLNSCSPSIESQTGAIFGYDIDVVLTRYGSMRYVAEDQVIGKALHKYGEWAEHEIGCLSSLLEKPACIVDVGANIGTHSLAFSRRFPTAKIIAIEPQPLAYAILCANILDNDRRNIEPLNCGCDNRSAILEAAMDLVDHDHNIGAVSLRAPNSGAGRGLPVIVSQLDQLIGEQKVDLIKIDVEGMELGVLEGASQTLERHRPIVFLEVLSIERVAAVRDLLGALSYDLRWLETSAFNSQNFRGDPENIWWYGETGILAMPHSADPRVAHLPGVTGNEPAIPNMAYASREALAQRAREAAQTREPAQAPTKAKEDAPAEKAQSGPPTVPEAPS